MVRALAIFIALSAVPQAHAAQQQPDHWPAVSRNQSRTATPSPLKGRVATNFCQDLCYCWTDPKITMVDQSACVYNHNESRYECTSLMFYSCAKKTAPDGRVTCRTCM
jgi:hypothetical protein